MASASRRFCGSDLPGQSLTITCGMARSSFRASISEILVVADLFHPLDALAIELLLHRDVRQCRCRRGAVPVLLACREPHHIAWLDLRNRVTPPLHATEPRRHDQRLSEWVCMPRG